MSKSVSVKTRIRHFLIDKNSDVHKAFNAALDKRKPGFSRKFSPFLWLYLLYLNIKFRVFKIKGAPSPQRGVQSGFPRISPVKLYQRIEKNDILSLDLLGTMVLFPFTSMTALYQFCELENGIPGFAKIRMEAEKDAKNKYGSKFSMEDIYCFVEDACGLSAKLGIKQEEEKILSLIEPNSYIKMLYDFHLVKGKTVIVMADTFWTKDFVGKVLEKCGYMDISAVYLSSELLYSKADKQMYDAVQKDFSEQSIFHIGNDSVVDIKNAREKGIAGAKYIGVHKLSRSFSYSSVTRFHREVFAGLANNHLYSWENTNSPFYEYGFVCGGPVVHGFCSWLHDRLTEKGVEGVIFVDGPQSVFLNAYAEKYPDQDIRSLCWSPTLSLRYSTDVDSTMWLHRLLRGNIPLQNELIQALFVLYPELYTQDAKNMESEEFLKIHKEKILHMLLFDSARVVDMVGESIAGVKKIALVGWQGGYSGPLALKRFIQREIGTEYDISCYSLFSAAADQYPAAEEVYTVSSSKNKDGYAALKKNKKKTIHMLELVSGTWMPDLIGIREDGSYLFDVPDAEKHWRFCEAARGINAFIELYEDMHKILPDFPAISGSDAYGTHRAYLQHAINQKKSGVFSFADESDKTYALTSLVESYVVGKRGV